MKNTPCAILRFPALFCLLLLTLLLPHTAEAWLCECGCADPACPNYQSKCYAGGSRLWNLQTPDKAYDDIENDSGTIRFTEDGIVVDNIQRDHSWTYTYTASEGYRHYTQWRARLEVSPLTGGTWAGIGMGNASLQIVFRVDRNAHAQFAVILPDISATTVESFTLPEAFQDALKAHFMLGLDYDVRTAELVASVDDHEVRRITLPHEGIPAISSLYKFCIETRNPVHSRMGRATYPYFTVRGHN